MKVLAIAGSLRNASINAAFCRAAAQLAPPELEIIVYEKLGQVPLFNPDLDDSPPPVVTALRLSISSVDALLIASPEYAHGVSGVMKNLLDWLVSCEGFVGKPVAVVNTSPRAHHAYDALLETLRTMSATLISEGCTAIQLLGACTTEAQMLDSPSVSVQIRSILGGIAASLSGGRPPGPSIAV